MLGPCESTALFLMSRIDRTELQVCAKRRLRARELCYPRLQPVPGASNNVRICRIQLALPARCRDQTIGRNASRSHYSGSASGWTPQRSSDSSDQSSKQDLYGKLQNTRVAIRAGQFAEVYIRDAGIGLAKVR